MFEWIEIQWVRFNLWLDEKQAHPGYRVKVLYDKERGFRVMRWWLGKPPPDHAADVERRKKEAERRERLRKFKGQ